MRLARRARDAFQRALTDARFKAKDSLCSELYCREIPSPSLLHIESGLWRRDQKSRHLVLERDCSLSAPHQKVIRMAPAPGMSPSNARCDGRQRVTAAEAIGYCRMRAPIVFIVEARRADKRNGFRFHWREHPFGRWKHTRDRGHHWPIRASSMAVCGLRGRGCRCGRRMNMSIPAPRRGADLCRGCARVLARTGTLTHLQFTPRVRFCRQRRVRQRYDQPVHIR